MIRPLSLGALTLLVVAGFASTTWAASYGTFMDPAGTVTYENVADVNGLYGAPMVSANSLDFTPVGFQAQCSQCPTGVETTDTLTFTIQTTPGHRATTIDINEGLDWALQSFDPTGFASVSVLANVFIDILQIDQTNVNNINAIVPIEFNPTDSASVFGFGLDNGIIIGGALIDLDAIAGAAGATGGVTRVAISFDNTLRAFHDGSGGQASIRKRDLDFVSLAIEIVPTPMPEPTTAVLLMGGLAALASRKRTA